jgi:hypothetical protein
VSNRQDNLISNNVLSAHILQEHNENLAADGVLLPRYPGLADNVRQAIACNVPDHLLFPFIPFTVKILPDVPTWRPFAWDRFHLTGKDIQISVVIQIANVETMVCPSSSIISIGYIVSFPDTPVTVHVLHPPDLAAGYLGIRENNIVPPIAIHVADYASGCIKSPRLLKIRWKWTARAYGMLNPLGAVSIDVLEPDICAHDIQIPIAIHISQGGSSMYRLSHIVSNPRLDWIIRYLIPAQVISI